MKSMKNIAAIIFLTILGLSFYAVTIRGVYGNIDMMNVKGNLDIATKPLELSPERGRYVLTYSLAERGTFALNEQLATVADPDVGFYKDKFYIFFAPGVSVLALPLYYLGKLYNIPQVASFFTVSIFATLNLLLIYIYSRRIFGISVLFSILAAVIFGFASTSWNYAITLYQHHVTTFFILSAFLAAYEYTLAKKMKWLYASYVWIAYGLAIFLDYPNILLMAPIIGYLLYSSIKIDHNKKNLILTPHLPALIASVFFFALVGLHGYYNFIHFDSWTRLSGSLIGFDKVRETRAADKKIKAEKKIEELANAKSSEVFFKEENLPRGFSILTFSPDRGLFIFSPIFYLAILGVLKKIKKGVETHIFFLLSIVFVNLFLYGSWGDPWGGWAYGPRYLIPTMAIGSSFIAFWLYKNRAPIFSRLLTYILFVFSAMVALLGALTTNQVPPKVEADFFGLNYNFFLNLQYLLDNKSSSFVYNYFYADKITLPNFFMSILIALGIIAAIIIFLAPVEKHEA
jgi:hypothetical protein